MKIKSIVIIVSLITAFAIVICFAKIKSSEYSNVITDVFSKATYQYDKTYIVKQNGEKIGVYEMLNDDLYLAIDTYIFTLPMSDQNMIENGFKITGDEIIHVIEDYTG